MARATGAGLSRIETVCVARYRRRHLGFDVETIRFRESGVSPFVRRSAFARWLIEATVLTLAPIPA